MCVMQEYKSGMEKKTEEKKEINEDVFLKQCCRRKPKCSSAVKILQLVHRKPPGRIYGCSEREPNI